VGKCPEKKRPKSHTEIQARARPVFALAGATARALGSAPSGSRARAITHKVIHVKPYEQLVIWTMVAIAAVVIVLLVLVMP
jgi:hypothetical protein